MSFPIRLDPSEGYEFEALARYNAEVGRGIAHTPEWDALMAEEQRRFNDKQEADWIAQGGYQLDGDGAWIIPGRPPSRWDRIRWWFEDLFR